MGFDIGQTIENLRRKFDYEYDKKRRDEEARKGYPNYEPKTKFKKPENNSSTPRPTTKFTSGSWSDNSLITKPRKDVKKAINYLLQKQPQLFFNYKIAVNTNFSAAVYNVPINLGQILQLMDNNLRYNYMRTWYSGNKTAGYGNGKESLIYKFPITELLNNFGHEVIKKYALLFQYSLTNSCVYVLTRPFDNNDFPTTVIYGEKDDKKYFVYCLTPAFMLCHLDIFYTRNGKSKFPGQIKDTLLKYIVPKYQQL